MFKLAKKYQLNLAYFNRYVDSVKKSVVYPYDNSCAVGFFLRSYYKRIEDYFFTGNMYEAWKHVEEAELNFKEAINMDPLLFGGYLKLGQLYEKLGRYTEAEEVIKNASLADKELSDRELNAFYRRTIEKFPDDGNWQYKIGSLLYKYAPAATIFPYLDSIVYFPLLNKELLIDAGILEKLKTNEYYALDKSITGTPGKIELNPELSRFILTYNNSVLIRTLNDSLFEEEMNPIIIPGTDEHLAKAPHIYYPRKDGIRYLKSAAALLSEKEALADIHFKTGNIYLWAGSKKQAYPYFEKSISLVADNANARIKLIDIYTTLYKNSSALVQLNYLYDSSQINFEKRMLLAEFDIHAGEFEKANSLLNKAEVIYPYRVPEITGLRGRLNMLANKPKEAIRFYENYSNQVLNDKRKISAYTLARLYAKTGNNNKAIQWLETSIGYGFNYYFVLQNDPLMNNLRKTAKWQSLVSNISFKDYKTVKTAEKN